MKKFIVFWDAGYGRSYEVVEVADEDSATALAYESWKEEAENNSDYGSIEWTEESEERYCL